MAWYINRYYCEDCKTPWEDEWSCMCDDECPNCQSSDYSPRESEDLSVYAKWNGELYEIYVSPTTAGNSPDYVLLASTPNRRFAKVLEGAARNIPDKYLGQTSSEI